MKIYLTGIKGVAMTALACYLQERGNIVTGSDVPEVFPTELSLNRLKVDINEGFDVKNIHRFRPDMLIYTGAHGGSRNPEVVEAKKLGIPVYPHGVALGKYMEKSRQLSVAGSHGKTTTSAILATLLSPAPINASYAVGCGYICPDILSGHAGEGSWFVAEADEYKTDPGTDDTPRFMWQKPEMLIVTNIDYDHPDSYKDINAVCIAFQRLADRMDHDSLIVANGDDARAAKIIPRGNMETVGFGSNCSWRISQIRQQPQGSQYLLSDGNGQTFEIRIRIPGKHNIYNSALAAVAAWRVGLDQKIIRDRLFGFNGTARRLELIGVSGSVRIIDDYAHHPNEIKSSLSALKTKYSSDQIICVFQPHTYSRTKSLLTGFGTCFTDADRVIITDIYASAREKSDLGINSRILTKVIAKHQHQVHYSPGWQDVYSILRSFANKPVVIVFMGAGDIYNYARKYVKEFI